MSAPFATLITCSFSGDFEVCRLLCESADRFVPDGFEHRLFVPARDLPLFAGLASRRRTVAPQEELLPRWFWKAPLPGPKWRARLRLPRRNVYFTPVSGPVRGWIAQQIMKIAATLRAATDIVAHIDSDNMFIRPLSSRNFVRDGRVRLYANPSSIGLATHKPWYAAAAGLLGLPSADVYSADYIDQPLVWRRSVVENMVARIEETRSSDWRAALVRTQALSEYVLHGVFVERVLGVETAGLFAEPAPLGHSRWAGRIDGPEEASGFARDLGRHQVACGIQSTISMTVEERRRVFAEVVAVAERQDSEGG